MLVVAVIIFNGYSFLGFLRTDLSPLGYRKGYRNREFLAALYRLIVFMSHFSLMFYSKKWRLTFNKTSFCLALLIPEIFFLILSVV